jgi:putative flippase GtrA
LLQKLLGYNMVYTVGKIIATAVVMVYNFVTRKKFLEQK